MENQNLNLAPEGAKSPRKVDTATIVGLGLLTAIVVVLQALAVGIRFGVFNITLVLIPIVVGAALYGWKAGAWLGFVFGVVVLFTDAGAFLAVNVPGTVVTCILKGALAGLSAGVVYRAIERKNPAAAAVAAGIVSPIVNTGVFLLGCSIFFLDTIREWAAGAGFESAGAYMITAFVGVNFIVEMAINLVLSSAIVLIVKLGKRLRR
ncbi:MAG: ECF transporter S component [Bacteroides sp.]|nr:ECF transporter S component [Roseburia sp.]MCM1462523.1 ECF transporter S component [Bacteroides sp.]